MPPVLLAVAVLFVSVLLCPVTAARAQDNDTLHTTRKFAYDGADAGTQWRLAQIPGRRFLDFDVHPVDALPFLAANGFNAIRVESRYGKPLTTPVVENANIDQQQGQAEDVTPQHKRNHMFRSGLGQVG